MEYICLCGRTFEKGQSLYAHRSWCSLYKSTSKRKGPIGGAIKGTQLKKDWVCPFCNELKNTTSSGFSHHKMWCKKNPERIQSSFLNKKHTEEQKRKISESMKKAHKEGRAHVWTHRVTEPTRPEQFLIDVLKNELNMECGKDYIRELPYNGFFLDFCWVDRKIVIEMNGEQHQTLQEQIERDKRKDALLKADGYTELRIPWKDCFHNPKEWILKVKDLLK